MDIRGSAGFALTGVEVARSRWAGFRGLMLRPPAPLLLPTSTVHGFWLHRPLWVVGVGTDGSVVGVTKLHRRRVTWLRGAAWILELPPERIPPQPGERLVFHAPAGEAVPDAGTSLPLCHSDRQPR